MKGPVERGPRGGAYVRGAGGSKRYLPDLRTWATPGARTPVVRPEASTTTRALAASRAQVTSDRIRTWAAAAKSRPQGSDAPVDAPPEAFHEAFAKAFKDSPFKHHVTHYGLDDLKGMKLYMTPDGRAGVAVHDHGDGRIEATALFNQGGAKGAGLRLLQHAIDKGGANYVECYGPVLNKLYEKLGFEAESVSPFNPEYAAPGWDYTAFPAATSSYYTMRLRKKR